MTHALAHNLVAALAQRRPNETVLIDGTTELSRADLQAMATKEATRLIEAGVRPGSRVVLCVPADSAFSVAALAVMMVGASYVPADPGADAATLERVREVTRPALWMGAPHPCIAPQGVPTLTAPRVSGPVDEPTSAERNMVASVSRLISPDDEVYSIFTSGTTGLPKGISIPHGALSNLLHWQSSVFKLRPTDRLLQRSRLLFDFSVTELWLPLTHGGTLMYCPEGIRNDPSKVLEFIRTGGITIAQFVPTVLEALLAAAGGEPDPDFPDALRGVVCNGEPLSDGTRRRFYHLWSHATLWNQYGPAEATVAVTSHKCAHGAEPRAMTVGRPMGGNRLLVLGEDLEPVPVGGVGEVCIAGPQLATRYLGASAEEANHFMVLPATDERLYRTGDVGRYTVAGELELLGRLDHQAKFRGIRLELDAVAQTVEGVNGVRQAAVRVRSFDAPDGRRRQVLTALVTPGDVDPASVKAHCRARLPAYSVPGLVMPVDEFRITANGKLDFDAHVHQAAESHRTARAAEKRSGGSTLDIIIDILQSRFGAQDLGDLRDVELDSLGVDSLDRIVLVRELETRGVTLSLDQVANPAITPRAIARACTGPSGRSRRFSMSLSAEEVVQGFDAVTAGAVKPLTVLVHASVPHLLEASPCTDASRLRAVLVDHLGALADGGATVVIPAFTPSFATTRSYHHHRSVSESGSLATWIIDDLAEAVRTEDPMYSYVVLGPQRSLPMAPPPSPFGAGSVAEWLEERDATIVGLATREFTQTHRIEFLAQAPHHSTYERVQGTADYGSGVLEVTGYAYVRDLDYYGAGAVFAQNTAMTESLVADVLRVCRLGNSDACVRSITCLNLRRTLLPLLRRDPLALLATPTLAMARLGTAPPSSPPGEHLGD